MQDKIIHILKLLNDPDKNISKIAKQELKKIENIEQQLQYILTDKNIHTLPIDKDGIRNLLTEVIFEKAYNFFSEWKNNSEVSLLKPLFWIAKIKYPLLQYYEIEQKIDNLDKIIEVDTKNLTPIEKLLSVNTILYKNLKLQSIYGLRKADDFMINKVLETGYSGMSMTAAFYTIIADKKELNLTLFKGSENLAMAYVKYGINHREPRIYFFINPYYKGTISNYDNFMRLLEQEKLNHKTFFKILSNLDIIKRIVSDIKRILQNRESLLYNYYEKIFKLLY